MGFPSVTGSVITLVGFPNVIESVTHFGGIPCVGLDLLSRETTSHDCIPTLKLELINPKLGLVHNISRLTFNSQLPTHSFLHSSPNNNYGVHCSPDHLFL